MSAQGDDVCNAGDPESKSNIILETSADCSGWSDLYAIYSNSGSGADPDAFGYFYIGNTLTNSVIGYDDLGASTSYEIGADTSGDDSVITYFNATNKINEYTNAWSGTVYSKVIMFCTTNTSHITTSDVSTTCINDFGAAFPVERTRTDIDYYNNYSIPFTTIPQLIVSFSVNEPLNGTNINQTTSLNYSLYHVNTSADCNITNNNVEIEYLTGLSNGSYSFSFNNSYWASGWNNLSIYCNDTSNNATDIKSLFVDEIQPEILYVNYTQGSTTASLNNVWFTQDLVTISAATNDTNNYFFSINVTNNATGTEYIYFENTSIASYYEYSNQSNYSNFPAGTYKVLITAKDAHTKNKIDLKSEKFSYDGAKGAKFDDKVRTYLLDSEIESFGLIKKTDREMFDIKFKPNIKKFYINIEGQKSIDYVGEKYGFQGHFIIDGKYWYDLENKQGAKVNKVIKVSDTKYMVEMTKSPQVDRVLFESVGIINTNTETRYFYLTNLNVTVKDENTGNVINNVTFTYVGSETFTQELPDGNISFRWNGDTDFYFRFSADDYPERRHYILNPSYSPGSENINVYLLNTTTFNYFDILVFDAYSNPLTDVTVTAFTTVGGSSVPVETQLTGAGGSVVFYVDYNKDYTFQFTKTGYETASYTLRPATSIEPYNVYLNAETTNTTNYAQGLTFARSPFNNALVNDTSYNFNINLTSSVNDITSCTIYIYNYSTLLNSTAGTYNTSFCNASLGLNTGNYTYLTLKLGYSIESQPTTYYNVEYYVSDDSADQFSLKTLLDDITNFSGSGFDAWGLKLIAIVIIFLITAYLSQEADYFKDPEVLMMVVVVLVWVFSYINWFYLDIESMPDIAGLRKYFIFYMTTLATISVIWTRR